MPIYLQFASICSQAGQVLLTWGFSESPWPKRQIHEAGTCAQRHLCQTAASSPAVSRISNGQLMRHVIANISIRSNKTSKTSKDFPHFKRSHKEIPRPWSSHLPIFPQSAPHNRWNQIPSLRWRIESDLCTFQPPVTERRGVLAWIAA